VYICVYIYLSIYVYIIRSVSIREQDFWPELCKWWTTTEWDRTNSVLLWATPIYTLGKIFFSLNQVQVRIFYTYITLSILYMTCSLFLTFLSKLPVKYKFLPYSYQHSNGLSINYSSSWNECSWARLKVKFVFIYLLSIGHYKSKSHKSKIEPNLIFPEIKFPVQG
jgi:hypothetical protein